LREYESAGALCSDVACSAGVPVLANRTNATTGGTQSEQDPTKKNFRACAFSEKNRDYAPKKRRDPPQPVPASTPLRFGKSI